MAVTLGLYTLPAFNAKDGLTKMIQMRRDVIEQACMAGMLDTVRSRTGRVDDMDVNAMARELRVSRGAKIALPLLPALVMPAVSDEDPGA